MSFIDIHCHILPGMDDGPSGLEESIEMLSIAAKDGISHIFATPHILDGMYPNRGTGIIAAVEGLRKFLPRGVELLCGADVRITRDLSAKTRAKEIVTLGDSGYLLIELPDYIVPPNLDALFYELAHQGITPVLTHPERHFRLMNDLDALRRARAAGAMCQITAMSVTGGFGREVRKAAFAMIEAGAADFVASDAHNADKRPPVLSKAYEAVKKHFGGNTSDTLFLTNPGKILKKVKQLASGQADKQQADKRASKKNSNG
ncbi:MAG: hypothetical protein M1497_07965 [Nitrospirae bacterium]|nr:hypothetical protein [Nitrospirota bacterium]